MKCMYKLCIMYMPTIYPYCIPDLKSTRDGTSTSIIHKYELIAKDTVGLV